MEDRLVPLIVGAGPTGLLLSLWLQKFSVPHRIVDAAPSTGTSARAVVFQARNLEFYRQLDLDDALIAKGIKVDTINVHHSSILRAELPMTNHGDGLTKYPYSLIVTQDDHEALLERTIIERGGKVEHNAKVVHVEESNEMDHVKVTLEVDGKQETHIASYVIGCDGAHSAVRRACNIDMEGGTYTRSFYVADVIGNGHPFKPGQMNLCLSQEDFTMIIPLPHKQGRARLIGFVPRSVEAKDPTTTTFDDVVPVLRRNAKNFVVEQVNWFSRYKVHHRTAARFQQNRVFLCGDAAHIHSPAGGQGMNTGLGDATNLAWKLAAVYHDGAPRSLLDTYEPERMAFARVLVATTDYMFTKLTGDSYTSLFLRNFFIPYVAPLVLRFVSLGPIMFQTASQCGIEYRGRPMSVNAGGDTSRNDKTGAVQAGDRLPWIENVGVHADDDQAQTKKDNHCDNYKVFSQANNWWHAHIYYGPDLNTDDADKIQTILQRKKIPLYRFPWNGESMSRTGLRRNVTYLVRPDGHVGLVLAAAATATERLKQQQQLDVELETYLGRWGVVGRE